MGASVTGVTVRIYTKPRCPLCEEARGVLEELLTRVEFVLEVVDIRDHVDTWERYRHAVPVITLDGEEIARLRVDAAALESRLRGTGVA
ncbi:MAG TPA: glutaredoxin family protein [Myxococcaceae bacterium]|jgi:glutaredoxin|nr:glutaredoxin family protein [Myxococcaceae bacterium]